MLKPLQDAFLSDAFNLMFRYTYHLLSNWKSEADWQLLSVLMD